MATGGETVTFQKRDPARWHLQVECAMEDCL